MEPKNPEDKSVQNQDATPDADAAPKGDDGLSNKGWKEDPRTLKLTSELAAAKRAQAEAREKMAAEKKAAERAKEIAAAEEQGKQRDLIESLQKRLEEAESKRAATAQLAELKIGLMQAKFDDKYFMDSVITKYDSGVHGSIEDYVNMLASDDANRKYMSSFQSKGPVIPPGKLPTGGSMAGVNAAQIKAMQASNDPKQRSEARRFLREYFDKHGTFPEGFN